MKRIITCLLFCSGLPRPPFACPGNDEVHNRHCEPVGRGNPETEKKTGFTLIELLISLIIISLITSAFVPMLSKKLKHREISYSSVKQMKIDCTPYDATDGTCLLCTETQCNLCTSSINIPNGYYVDSTVTCNRQECTNLFTNCKRCTKAGCQECNNGYTLKSDGTCSQVTCNKGYKVVNSTCELCPENSIQPNDNSTATTCSSCSADQISNANRTQCTTVTCSSSQYKDGTQCKECNTAMSNCSKCSNASTCLECENGYSMSDGKCGKYEEPLKQADCGEYALFVSSAYNGTGSKNLCVSKYNMGDANGPSIPSDYHQLSVGSDTKCTVSDYKCYWVGDTANTASVTRGVYSARYRTVISNYDISTTGRNLCEGWNYLGLGRNNSYWRMPTIAELDSWRAKLKDNSDIFGYLGLDFCSDDSTLTGYSRCDSAMNKCKTDNNNNCNPSHIMADSLKFSSGKYYRYVLSIYSGTGNTWKTGYTDVYMYALSVRCVTDKVFKQ